MPLALWRCWLGGRKGIRPVKTEWWGAGVVVCLERGADLHMAQLMPLPLTVSCFSKIQIGFTFLVPAYLGSPGRRAVKRVCVCVSIQIDRSGTKTNWVRYQVKNGSQQTTNAPTTTPSVLAALLLHYYNTIEILPFYRRRFSLFIRTDFRFSRRQ